MIKNQQHILLIGIEEFTACQLEVLLEIDNDKTKEQITRLGEDPEYRQAVIGLRERMENFQTVIDTLRRTRRQEP